MKVKLFAHLQTEAGCGEIELSPAGKITADELWQMLDGKIPGITRHKNSTRVAKNYVYTTLDETFSDADEIALIPPVSGG
ncbi:MAG TPA: MoaD/ThiS family protein [Chthoniobacteraceae bacterium]|nr:MoaD/ThiS family protein [Chthoniobacteraceae bacterium]